MLRLVYNALIYAAAPIAWLANVWRGLRDPLYRDRLGERFGFSGLRVAAPTIWVHAVSVGEVQASVALVRELRRRFPQQPIVMTTGTPTGAQRVQTLFKDTVLHSYLPYDTPGAVKRFLDRVRPRIAIVMETEVWPNLFRECARRRIPIVIASARLSAKSVRGYRWLASLFRDALTNGIQIAAQTQGDADRFVSVGANPQTTRVVGNIKFDIEVPAETRAQGAAFRAMNFAGRSVWIAGSTHAGEEDIVLAAHDQVRRTHANALLVLVPRHPNRFDAVKNWLKSKSIAFVARSSNHPVDATTSVLLVDTLGELLMFYAAADVAFVGGSLTPIGGHSLLEPAALRIPFITGPFNFNAPDIARLFLLNGAALEVNTCELLAQNVGDLLSSPSRREELGARALALVQSNRGTVQRLLVVIAPHLEK